MNIDICEDGSIVLSDFNALQSFKIARKLEADGMTFYRQLLESAKDTKMNSAVKYLLDSEVDHFKFFESKIEILQAENEDGFEDDDISDFINSDIFTPEELVQRENIDFSNAASAIQYGIIVESKSIAFYSALLENTSDAAAQSAIREIIAEEEKHLETLREFV